MIDKWSDIDVFDRSDAERAEQEFIPWGKRIFPSAHRWWIEHDEKIDEALSEVMLSSAGFNDD